MIRRLLYGSRTNMGLPRMLIPLVIALVVCVMSNNELSHGAAEQDPPQAVCQGSVNHQQVININPPASDTPPVVSSELKRLVDTCNRGHLETHRQLEQLLAAVLEQRVKPSEMTTSQETTQHPPEQLFTTVSSLVNQKDCTEVLANGVTTSGIYRVQPLDNGGTVMVYCDMDTDGGGWTIFQRRRDGSVDFYRNFANYSQGFGELNGEFWLGNDNLNRLTTQGEYELRVDLTDFEGNYAYAVYDSFSIADVSDNYRLTVGGYSGTAGDSLTGHSGRPFTTKDNDNDDHDESNCAQRYHGAWWYSGCHRSNLNGDYLGGETTVFAKGVVWNAWMGYHYSLKTTEMKIRMKN